MSSDLQVEDFMIPMVGKTAKYLSTLIRNKFGQNNIQLSKEQFVVLHHLKDGSKAQSYLANITERDKGSLTRLLQSLERKEMINRSSSIVDSRVNEVAITTKGLKMLEDVKPLLFEVFENMEQGISQEEKRIFRSVLKKMRERALFELDQLVNQKEQQA